MRHYEQMKRSQTLYCNARRTLKRGAGSQSLRKVCIVRHVIGLNIDSLINTTWRVLAPHRVYVKIHVVICEIVTP